MSYKFIVPDHLKGIYTTWEQAHEINKILKKYTTENDIITDATACIGGNSVFFKKDFRCVNIIEKDPDVFNILKKNTSFSKCKHYNCSYLNIMYTLKQDIIFLDPPWGGTYYKKSGNINLYLDNVNVTTIINNLYHHARYIAMKVPTNYNLVDVNKDFWDWKIYPICCYKKKIYNLIIFYKNT